MKLNLGQIGKDALVRLLTETADLSSEIDDVIEQSQRGYLEMEAVIPTLLKILRTHVCSDLAFLAAPDGTGNNVIWKDGRELPDSVRGTLEACGASGFTGAITESDSCLYQPLEIADGSRVGIAGVRVAPDTDSDRRLKVRYKLHAFCEEVDNYILDSLLSRKKHRLQLAIGQSLQQRVFSQALIDAITLLKKSIDFNTLIILYYDENDAEAFQVKYLIYSEGMGFFDPYQYRDKDVHQAITRYGSSIMEGDLQPLRDRFPINHFLEEFMITGIITQKRIGKVIIASDTSWFDQFEREMLDIFVSFIQQRLIDFNKDWRRLSQHFSVPHRIKLLEKKNYLETDLAPKIAPVAIMYADISSFTFFSEQILKEPQIITEFIDIWAKGAVARLWQNEGCFDKLVGDCAIGIFGPPFYTLEAVENCRNALRCSQQIVSDTMDLLKRDETCFKLIRDSGKADLFGVSIGVSFGEVNVGLIGPNADFTCFGSTMNNAARIQGAAARNEILLLDPVLRQVEGLCRLDGPFTVELKNVSGRVEYYRFIDFL